jgi:hypothetical protein
VFVWPFELFANWVENFINDDSLALESPPEVSEDVEFAEHMVPRDFICRLLLSHRYADGLSS